MLYFEMTKSEAGKIWEGIGDKREANGGVEGEGGGLRRRDGEVSDERDDVRVREEEIVETIKVSQSWRVGF